MSARPVLPAASSFFRVFFELSAGCPQARQCQHATRRIHSIARASTPSHTSKQLRSLRHSGSRHSSSSTKTSSKTIANSRHPSDDYPDVYDPRRPVEPLSSSPEETPSPASLASSAPSSTSATSVPPNDTLSTPLRHLMRLVPHPVTLITSSLPSSSSTSPESNFRGATVSSFNTVTLTPTPLVSLNMKLPSSTYTALQESNGTFLAHILAANYKGEMIADAFARGNGRGGEVFASLAGVGSDQDEDKDAPNGGNAAVRRKTDVKIFTGLATGGAPLLASEGVIKVLRCRALEGKEVVVGDHVVLVAAVEGILSAPGSGGEATKRRRSAGAGNALNYVRGDDEAAQDEGGWEKEVHGLVYVDGAYRSVDRDTDLVDMEAVDPDGEDVAEQDNSQDEPIQRTIGLNVRRGDEYV